MNTILKYNLDELFRYLFSIVCIILSLRLLVVPEAIENYRLFGVADHIRQIMGVGGLIASVLFIIEKTVYIGAAFLLLGIAYALFHHMNVGQTTSWLIFLGGGILIVLLFAFKRRTWIEDVEN